MNIIRQVQFVIVHDDGSRVVIGVGEEAKLLEGLFGDLEKAKWSADKAVERAGI